MGRRAAKFTCAVADSACPFDPKMPVSDLDPLLMTLTPCYSWEVEAVVTEELSGADRRARPRISVAIEVKLHAPEHHYMLMSRTIDLSTMGAFVRTNRPLPIGADVTVSFNRGNDRNPLMLDAAVVRSGTADGGRQRGVAIRFTDLSDLDEVLLSELISRSRS